MARSYYQIAESWTIQIQNIPISGFNVYLLLHGAGHKSAYSRFVVESTEKNLQCW
jgi:hypothetical protein